MTAKKRNAIIASVTGAAIAASIAWLAGFDFNERGTKAVCAFAGALFVAFVAGGVAHDCTD